jgi:hypothetical protein
MRRHDDAVVQVGVEGISSYGAGLARHLTSEEIEVVEGHSADRHPGQRTSRV